MNNNLFLMNTDAVVKVMKYGPFSASNPSISVVLRRFYVCFPYQVAPKSTPFTTQR
jgi:hypothetical protein